jgi:hypothetical protein
MDAMAKTAGTTSATVERMSMVDSEIRGEAVWYPFDGGTGGA